MQFLPDVFQRHNLIYERAVLTIKPKGFRIRHAAERPVLTQTT